MITSLDHEGLDAFCLSNDRVEVVIVPEAGGKIVSLRRVGGREWLWRNSHLAQTKPSYGESFVELHDTGGWDECFPTVNSCTLPNGLQLPDHGELVTQTWRVEEAVDNSIRMSVKGVRLPYQFERTITLIEDGLQIEYRAENLSDRAIPFLWACHPLFTIEPGMSIDLPRNPPGRLSFATNDINPGTTFVWPDLEGFPLDFILDPTVFKAGLKSFVGPLDEGRVALRSSTEEIQISFDTEQISHIAFWMNYGAWSGCGSKPYFNLGIEPCIGPFDALDEALSADLAPTLSARETREWKLKIALRETVG